MKAIKTKSLNPAYSDSDIEHGSHSVGFISFERAVRLSEDEDKRYGMKGLVIGYRVIEDGIEIIYE